MKPEIDLNNNFNTEFLRQNKHTVSPLQRSVGLYCFRKGSLFSLRIIVSLYLIN
jgi:hypothetical protein